MSMDNLLSADAFALANGIWSLIVLVFWTVSGITRSHDASRFENFVTFMVGCVFFLLSYGSWEFVYGSATPYRIYAFTAVLSVLGVGVLLHDRRNR